MDMDIGARRRALLRGGAVAAAGLALGDALLPAAAAAETSSLTKGDVAILRFLAVAEAIEADLWVQYNELGGVQDNERPELGGGGSPAYTAALANLDSDMAQYIHDNTDDELSHAQFLDAYLASRGVAPVELDRFRILPSSRASGARQIGRLTNLMQLTVDTSWYTRYRSSVRNPDLSHDTSFPQAVPSLAAGRYPAIPRDDSDLAPAGHIQAIANTASFHFCLIEQGGTSLYPALAQGVTSLQVLRILFSIGPVEACHFQTWHDKAGNAVQPPLAPLQDPSAPGLVFPNLNGAPHGGPLYRTNLIMPEPVPFLHESLPPVSVVRPTGKPQAGAVAAIQGFVQQGLFLGQSRDFVDLLMHLARDADAASRQ